jgi:hypothetical protein
MVVAPADPEELAIEARALDGRTVRGSGLEVHAV